MAAITENTTPASARGGHVDLAITGMTCASCAARIEKRLNKLDGVTATVNYATEKARVTAAAGVDPALLVAQVEAAGYTAELPAPRCPSRTRSSTRWTPCVSGCSSAWCCRCRSSRWR